MNMKIIAKKIVDFFRTSFNSEFKKHKDNRKSFKRSGYAMFIGVAVLIFLGFVPMINA